MQLAEPHGVWRKTLRFGFEQGFTLLPSCGQPVIYGRLISRMNDVHQFHARLATILLALKSPNPGASFLFAPPGISIQVLLQSKLGRQKAIGASSIMQQGHRRVHNGTHESIVGTWFVLRLLKTERLTSSLIHSNIK